MEYSARKKTSEWVWRSRKELVKGASSGRTRRLAVADASVG